MARCKTCQAEIVWMLTSAGKRVPLDPPEKRYVENLTSTHRGQVEVQDTWLSHFATCPQAAVSTRATAAKAWKRSIWPLIPSDAG